MILNNSQSFLESFDPLEFAEKEAEKQFPLLKSNLIVLFLFLFGKCSIYIYILNWIAL